MEILVTAEDPSQASRHNAHKLGASRITLEIYNFDEERHEIWDVPCIQPSDSENFVVLSAKVSWCLLLF